MNNSIEEEGSIYSREGRVSRRSFQEADFLISREESMDEYLTEQYHKVMVLGAPGVGKTLLLQKFVATDSHENEIGTSKYHNSII